MQNSTDSETSSRLKKQVHVAPAFVLIKAPV